MFYNYNLSIQNMQQPRTEFIFPLTTPPTQVLTPKPTLTFKLQKPNHDLSKQPIMAKSSLFTINKQSQPNIQKQIKENKAQHKSDKFHKFSLVQKLLQHHTLPIDSRKINKKIYILYTSGSVGANQKLQVYQNYLREKMMQNYYLCDYKVTQENQDHQFLISPVLQNGYRVQYFIENAPFIQASVNMKLQQVIYIAQKIKQNYHKYDAFVIISGFDVISYISTLISFMLQNLSKLVIFTGAHFPISYCRNDFINNIIESFTIISLAKGLNDVLIVCKNKGYRANRCIKVKQNQMDTVKSPNIHSLASIDIKIRFKYHLFLPAPTQQFSVFTAVSQKVHILKFHLYINKQILKYELKNPNIIGYVIQSYTAANLPQSQQLLQIFKQASQNDGKIFLNISQNIHKQKKSIMKEALQKYHIYFGGDMTSQAALSKLAYLIGKGYSKQQIKQKLSMNLRGQLTQTKTQNQFQRQTQGFMQVIQQVLQDYYPTSTQHKFTSILQDQIGKYITSKTTPQQFKLIYKYLKKLPEAQGMKYIIDRNFLLHHAVRHQNIQLISYFLDLPIQRDITDHDDCSAFFYAIKLCNKSIIQLLYKRYCHVICPVDLLMDLFISQIKTDNVDFFEMLFHIQFKTTLSDIINKQKRNVGHISALLSAQKCIDLFIVKYKFQLSQKDLYNCSIQDYLEQYKKKIQNKINITVLAPTKSLDG